MERRGARQEERDCVLCPPLRFRLNAMADLPGEPSVLAADDDFFLMPDLAPLIEGHVLLVTSRHIQCAGAFGRRQWAVAWQWRHRVGRVYRSAYGSSELLLLEHGPATPQGGGACVDHAHWHLIPVGPEPPSGRGVRALLEERGHPGMPATRDTVHRHFLTGRSYLLVEEQGRATVHPGEGVPSQYLRKAASQILVDEVSGRPWRWQELFMLPDSRTRFLRTLNDLRTAVARDDDVQRALTNLPQRERPTASHQ
jgi:diadenosine tetraphosphate (Ap4A) HIT family hydrolase